MSDLSLRFLAPHPWSWILLLIPALALAFWAYYRILAPLSRPAQWALWLLRALAFFLVLFALGQPVLTAVLRDAGRPGLAVLLDRSLSMSLPGGGSVPGISRTQEVERVLPAIREELSGRYRLQWYAFSDHLHPFSPDSALVPRGNTALGQALEEVLTSSQDRPVNGILLLSDGVSTGGRDPVRAAAASPVPIFSLGVGPERPIADATIHRVRSNPTAFVGEPLPIQAVVASWGLGGENARLEVRENGTVVAGHDLQLVGNGGLEQEVTLEVRPRTPGLALYEVGIGAARDSVSEDDKRLIAVEVLERKSKVLVLAPRPDWDFAFLKRALQADTTLSYSFLAQFAPGEIRSLGEKVPLRWPQTVEELRPFAAVLLVGLDEQGLPEPTLTALARFVREGGGLCLFGGPGRGAAWAGTGSFSEILPGKILPDPLPASRSLPVSVTGEGQRHPATALEDNPGETIALWAGLPPLFRPGCTLAAKPEGRTLLEYRVPRGPSLPALVVSFQERGKTAWLFGRGVWRWGFLTSADPGKARNLYPQFLLGLVHWMAEPAVRDRFQVGPAKRVFQNGEAPSFTAGLWDASYAPLSGASIELTVRPASDSLGERTRTIGLQAGSEAGQYDGQCDPLPPGSYQFKATAREAASSRELSRAEGRFWVERMGPELSRTWRDQDQLDQIARKSGGKAVGLAAWREILDQIPRGLRRIGRVREVEVWNHWLLFATFALVLSVEWFLRRRRGLA